MLRKQGFVPPAQTELAASAPAASAPVASLVTTVLNAQAEQAPAPATISQQTPAGGFTLPPLPPQSTFALSTAPWVEEAASTRRPAPGIGHQRQLSPRASRRLVERALRTAAKPAPTVAVASSVRTKRLSTSLLSIAAVASFVLVGALPQLGGTTTAAQAEIAPLQLAAAEESDQVLGIEAAPEVAVGRDAISATRTYAAYTMSWGSYTPNITAGIQWPIPFTAPITAGYGYRASTNSFHYGLDFTPGAGQPIVAMAEGTVTSAGYRGAYGNLVVINHPQLGVSSWYAHQAPGSLAVKVGDKVKAGMLVGRVGNTGRSSGAHLHFEIHNSGGAIDPYKWLKANAG